MGMKTRTALPLDRLTEIIIEGFYDTVHELGCGYGEAVCQRAYQIVLRGKGLLVEERFPLDVRFRGEEIGSFFADLVVERLVIVEVKALPQIEGFAIAQTLNYLKCAGGGVGFVANFGNPPAIKRLVVGNPANSLPGLPKDPVRNIQRWLDPAEPAQ